MMSSSHEGEANKANDGGATLTNRVDLTIVIVSWNTRDVLRDCLQSVFDNADSDSVEVFVVDNGSVDGTIEMVREQFQKARLICNPENRGFAAANNQAIQLGSGRYILLLNSDTIVLGNVLGQSVRYLDSHSEVGVMGCRVLNEDRTVQLTCFQYPTLLNLFLKATGLFHLRWPRFFGREQIAGCSVTPSGMSMS